MSEKNRTAKNETVTNCHQFKVLRFFILTLSHEEAFQKETNNSDNNLSHNRIMNLILVLGSDSLL